MNKSNQSLETGILQCATPRGPAVIAGLGVDVPELRQARALWQLGRFDEALNVFEAAVRKYPQNLVALVDASRAFGARFEIDRAEEMLDRLAKLGKNNAEVMHLAGQSYRMIFRPEKAMRCFERVLTVTRRNPDTFLELAVLYERRHRLPEALAMAEDCLRAEPGYEEAELFKGRLLRRLKEPAAAEELFRKLAANDRVHPLVRAQAWAEIAQKLDQEGDYDGAMQAMLRCKEFVKTDEKPVLEESERLQRVLHDLAHSLTPEILQRWATAPVSPPIRRQAVLTSFPRSGTTLLEQVLDSHPGLISSDEREVFGRDIFPAMWRSPTTPIPTAAALDAVPQERLKVQRERYFSYVAAALNQPLGDRVHLDKNPPMTLLIPGMLRLIPETRLLIALRDPRDVVVSCFMQYLPLNTNSVCYLSLERTAARFVHDMQIWLHLRGLLRTPWLEVHYEDCVRHLETEARRALEFLDLPWDPGVLNYRDRLKEKAVSSPTYEAVSKPLYTSSIARWKNYEKHLEPCFEVLRPCIEAFGYNH